MGTNIPHACFPGLVWQKRARRFPQFELKVGELGFPIHFVCVSAALYHRGHAAAIFFPLGEYGPFRFYTFVKARPPMWLLLHVSRRGVLFVSSLIAACSLGPCSLRKQSFYDHQANPHVHQQHVVLTAVNEDLDVQTHSERSSSSRDRRYDCTSIVASETLRVSCRQIRRTSKRERGAKTLVK